MQRREAGGIGRAWQRREQLSVDPAREVDRLRLRNPRRPHVPAGAREPARAEERLEVYEERGEQHRSEERRIDPDRRPRTAPKGPRTPGDARSGAHRTRAPHRSARRTRPPAGSPRRARGSAGRRTRRLRGGSRRPRAAAPPTRCVSPRMPKSTQAPTISTKTLKSASPAIARMVTGGSGRTGRRCRRPTAPRTDRRAPQGRTGSRTPSAQSGESVCLRGSRNPARKSGAAHWSGPWRSGAVTMRYVASVGIQSRASSTTFLLPTADSGGTERVA